MQEDCPQQARVTDPLRPARIRSMAYEAPGVMSIRLTDPKGRELPGYTPGAHIDLRLPTGITRSYSLIGAPYQFDVYEIGVARERDSRGASRWLHECARPGDLVEMSSPRNHFALAEDAAHSVLIGGGIGITPLIGMAERLHRLGRSFKFYLCARNRDAAFLDRLSALSSGIETYLSCGPAARRLDIAAVVEAAPNDAHLYCCGPARMIEAFEAASSNRAATHVHLERFTAAQQNAVEGGFLVELARSGITLAIPSGKSILDCLLEAGIDVNCSCMEGVCGSCETRVLSGAPDHRDGILNAAERAESRTMMICCSGSKSDRLLLDL